MVELRWQAGELKCPQCGSDKVCYLAKTRVWKCYANHPKPRCSLKTETIFEDSPIPLEKWLPAVWMLLNCKNGTSSSELHRTLGVTQKTAWFMLHRMRLAMQSQTPQQAQRPWRGSGGWRILHRGKSRNMHLDRKRRYQKVGRNTGGEASVIGMLERSKTVRTAVIEGRTKATMQPIVRDDVETGSEVYSDDWAGNWRMAGGQIRKEAGPGQHIHLQ
jgi:transposase-like protein